MFMVSSAPTMALAASVLAVMTAGCSRPPDPAKVGERLDYRGYAMTVTNVQRADDFPGARRARTGDTLIAVELLVEGNADHVQVSPAHIWVAEPGGKVFKAHSTGRAPILQAQDGVPKGQRVQGWLTFEVPKDARDLRLVNELPKEFNHVKLKVDLPWRAPEVLNGVVQGN